MQKNKGFEKYECRLIADALTVSDYNLFWKKNLIVSNLRGWAKKRTEAVYKNEILNCTNMEDLFYYNYRNEFDWARSFNFIRNSNAYKKSQCCDGVFVMTNCKDLETV